MTDLSTLATRVEGISGPSREVDALETLAREIEQAGIVAAKQTATKDPWYKTARQDMAHAANCFAVAAALRATQDTTR